MIAFVFQPKRKGQRSRLWSARVRLDSWLKPRTIPLHVTDKRVAEQRMREEIRQLELEAAGIVAPRAVREGAQRPIADHLADFLADLAAKGRAKNTLRAYRKCITKLCQRCGWRYLRDVTPESFTRWRSAGEVGPKFANDLLGYVGAMLNWLERQGVIGANPIRHVGKAQIRSCGGYRRALSVSEIERLLSNAPWKRAVVYLVMLYTGLRRHELNGLRWSDIDLGAQLPRISANGSITKNGKSATIVLRNEVVAALHRFRPVGADPAAWAFRGRVPSVRTLKIDLLAAGIPFEDTVGRRVDLHALRHTFGTLLSASNVSPRVAMELMRHSDIRLTMRVYTDAEKLPLVPEVNRLPAFNVNVGEAARVEES